MSIDLSRVTGISDSRGVITEIKDSAGRVIWSAVRKKPAVLEVVKTAVSSSSGEASYTDESVILLDIYPAKNATVKVTYGGLTKTVKDTSGADEPNALQVYFGTFQGVSDSVTTPESGTLTIEGNYRGFGVGSYTTQKSTTGHCSCITAVTDFGNPDFIPNYALYACAALTTANLPSGIASIGAHAFDDCTALTTVNMQSGLTIIGESAFENCKALISIILPDGLLRIERYAFYICYALDHVYIPASVTFLGANSLLCHNSTGDTSGILDGNYYFHSKTPPECEYVALTDGATPTGPFGTYRESMNIDIWVPVGYASAYKAASGWVEWSNRIQEKEGL